MIRVNEKRLVSTFLDLLRIDAPTFRERPAAEYLKKTFHGLGLKVAEDKSAAAIGGECGNLLVRIPGSACCPGLILVSHLDTILSTRDLRVWETGGVFRSDGATILGADDRAGVAVMIEIARILTGGGSPVPLELLFTVAEEKGLCGAKKIAPGWLKGKAALILDSGGPAGSAIYRAPFGEKIRVTIEGKAAHAGMEPEAGVNAVVIAARAISRMKLGRVDDETTANVGIIRGGEAVNIVPEKVVLEAEARSLNERKLIRQVRRMEAIIRGAAAELGGKAHFHAERDYHGFRLSRSLGLLKVLKKVCGDLGLPFRPEVSCGASDANLLNRLGISALDLSVGYYKPHTREESIARRDLVASAHLVLGVIEEIGKERIAHSA
ncbi:MAG: M20/M25/M40 family metallo-hydrolase [Candidatus Aureabacteria bacterium]|nr:M20/M25/M40 family metallo-hydrolase [Candidatus Auribacterota bacterium]